jgi:carbon catabolite-derepressing protein kinase
MRIGHHHSVKMRMTTIGEFQKIVQEFTLTIDRTNNNSFVSNASGGSLHREGSINRQDNSSSSLRFGRVNTDEQFKLPADPWVLRVRWRKDGMYPSFMILANPTYSSWIDLRRHSIASLSSATDSSPSPDIPLPKHNKNDADYNVVMHLDIQLYEMEQNVYLVDFKCAGYETRDGMLLEEKDVTSPFPFLDLASKLIIQLAEAD